MAKLTPSGRLKLYIKTRDARITDKNPTLEPFRSFFYLGTLCKLLIKHISLARLFFLCTNLWFCFLVCPCLSDRPFRTVVYYLPTAYLPGVDIAQFAGVELPYAPLRHTCPAWILLSL